MTQRITVLILGFSLITGCGDDAASRPASAVLRLAVTTSTRDSGLLDALVPRFERQHRVRVDVIAAGTGKALKLGEAGDVDVVLVHSRRDEDAFLAAGHGVRREDVMYNTFELLGPADDPAGIRGLPAPEALSRIAAAAQRFVSRGDDSGTHKRERTLWAAAVGRPEWTGYVETGQGMGATLIMADQMAAYVLADRGTFLRFKDKIDLVPLAAQSDALSNPYGILVVNPRIHPAVRGRLAHAFVDFMIAHDTQRIIRDYRVAGESLFHPLRLPECDESEQEVTTR